MDEGQFRRACDRCHNHKLRCKRNGASGCLRCIKAGVNCVFSPSLRVRKSRQGPAVDSEEGDQSLSSAADSNSNAKQQDNVPGPTTNQMLHSVSDPDGCVGIEDIMQFDLGSMDWSSQDADKSEYSLHPATRPLSKHDEAQQISLSSSDSIMESPKTTYTEFFAAPYKDVGGSQMNSHPGDTSADYASASAATPWILQTTQIGQMSPYQPQSLLSEDYQSSSNQKSVEDGGPPRYASGGDANPRVSRRDTWVRRLSNINIKLYQHAALISPRSSTHSSNYGSFPDGDGSFLPNKDVAVDQTFIITLQLLEILNNQHTPPNGSLRGTFADSPDHGTLLLIFSSYLRLLDVYSAIFHRLHTSLGPHPSRPSTSASTHHPSSTVCGTDAPNNACLPRFPTLRIGDFSLQAPSSLNALLVVQLAEQLLQRIYIAMQHLNRRRPQRHSVSESSHPRRPRDRYDTLDGDAEDSNVGDVSEVLLRSVQKCQMEAMGILREVKRALNSR
ncbi:uncharacterized protein TRUGW13939_05714 [Talaromyces rugulosus]|uniref:Zn(2)-C6 fungal-type domain-containing protein n=1 Tax=Talaromyces rugulosus TaxID=121627 RepID=A0A7H8QWZ6_TALRU|nr:uncharacterized protein TRUGW13939_05714 [Talaromyces rugulosus]QKX58589.1 hypothetical protein TRUGW13939_05714 [Talaromyces rugulosus]